jgi:hypothetical protein
LKSFITIEGPNVAEELHDQRFVEVVVSAQVLQLVGRQRAFTVEGTAGRQPQNEEADRNRDEHDRNSRKHAPERITEHVVWTFPASPRGNAVSRRQKCNLGPRGLNPAVPVEPVIPT